MKTCWEMRSFDTRAISNTLDTSKQTSKKSTPRKKVTGMAQYR